VTLRAQASRLGEGPREAGLFDAESAYAQSIFLQALGDIVGAVEALERSLEFKPDYAPAILSLGSVAYQRERRDDGRRLFMSLLSLPADVDDLAVIIDEAGMFLMDVSEYADALGLYRAATDRFPEEVEFHLGISCCAGHLGLHDEAVSASARAVELRPDDSVCASDLGWSLFEAGRVREAREVLERAVASDPTNDRAHENLRICTETAGERTCKRLAAPDKGME
jgi:tetratricopeptide (TPR) repeat protein